MEVAEQFGNIKPLPIAILREAIAYDESTGILIWKSRPSAHFLSDCACTIFNARFLGTPALASRHHQGYRNGAVSYLGRLHGLVAHRVAFAIAHGRWANPCVDHVNGVRDDNRLANLREATKLENSYNQGPSSRNLIGIKGVFRSGKKFSAHATLRGKRMNLGSFLTLEEAIDARRSFAAKHYGVFCRH
ncbi:HNH endonuclease [Methylobacterium sp. SD274]|uniref:HNH endonuclease n=1 Tax=Methylobacterium sp. SD274 TaxID=2782009 RepID=UPI001A95A998|nr:HNH endonuclease [Methylobacterium sp. SD274]MBO1020854.1 HNH endonuclease [Methylobacterium sp. SD274]